MNQMFNGLLLEILNTRAKLRLIIFSLKMAQSTKILRLLLPVLNIATQGQKLTKGSIGSDKKCLIAGPSLSLSPQLNMVRLVLVLLLRNNVLRCMASQV